MQRASSFLSYCGPLNGAEFDNMMENDLSETPATNEIIDADDEFFQETS